MMQGQLKMGFVALLVTLSPIFYVGTTEAGTKRYDGYKIVHINAKTPAEVDRIESFGGIILNCNPGPGPLDVALPGERLNVVTSLGIASKVVVDDLQAALDQSELQPSAVADTQDAFTDYFLTYRPYDGTGGVVWYLNELVNRYPGLASMVNVGTTLQGRTIWGVRITSNVHPTKPGVVYFGVEHAREWIAATVPPYFGNYLLSNYGTDATVTDLVDNVEFFLIPVFNVDGYVYTWSTDRLWRKNRRNNGDGTFGVDINRNWGEHFGGPGSSGATNNETYHGPFAFSEPETQVLRDFFINHPNVRAQLDLHSYSELILWPYGYTNALSPDQGAFAETGLDMQSLIQAVHGLQYAAGPINTTIYPASGVSVDWTYAQRGIFSFSIELRDTGQTGFQLPANQIIPQNEEVLPAMLRLTNAGWVRSPIRIDLPNGVPTSVTAGQDTTIGVRVVSQIETVVPGSETFYYRYDASGPFIAVQLASLGGDLYQATLPATNCTSTPEFYFSASGDGGSQVQSPAGAPGAGTYSALMIGPANTIYFNDLGANPGWTTQGQWAWGHPNGASVEAGFPDPTSGHTGSNVYGYNLNGGYPNNMPVYSLTTSPMNCTGQIGVHLAFWRWLGVESPTWDHAVVQASNNGISWTTIWQNTTEIADNAWTYQDMDISSVADNQQAVSIRWNMGPSDPGVTYCGWNIDDISLINHTCDSITGDSNGDGAVDSTDFNALTNCYSGENVLRPPGCKIFDSDLDGDVDCVDMAAFRANWTAGGVAPNLESCTGLESPTVSGEGSRYLLITPGQSPVPVALQVFSPALPCLSAYADFDSNPTLAAEHVARLVADPVYRDPAEWGTIHLGDADILPNTAYQVMATDAGATQSLAVEATTALWGDVTAPLGVIDIRDVAATVDRFVGSATLLAPMPRADLFPQRPDYVVDIRDVAATVDAFKDLAFPFPAPSQCH